MKTIKTILYPTLIFALFILFSGKTFSQNGSNDEIIKRAMKDEMDRNIKDLAIKDLKKPFFISYTICNAKTLQISATLGSIIKSDLKPYKKHNVKVMTGDYTRSNENYVDMNSMVNASIGGGNIPDEEDYFGIRRALWRSTDRKYKVAAEAYESKESAIKQQNIPEEEASLEDFSKVMKININIPSIDFDIDRSKWEQVAKELSAIFKGYPEIFSSNVSIYLYNAEVYFLNSEETETKSPLAIAAIRVNAFTQAEDGEPLYDHVLFYSLIPDDLPAIVEMREKVKAMADMLTSLRKAPVFDDSYSGPVLFEGQAAGEVIAQRLFASSSGLSAMRKPVFGQQQLALAMGQMLNDNLESKIDKKIIATDITIKSVPKLKKFNGINLIGSFEVDAEGVIPADVLILVENGILKTLLNGRTPTTKIKASNGHIKYMLQNGGIQPIIGPGVIYISSSNAKTKEELRKKLFEKAKEEGLDYAYVIKKIESPTSGAVKKIDQSLLFSFGSGKSNSGSISKPLYVYRISVMDGKEELVRSAKLGGISLSSLKRISGVSNKQFAYNTLISKSIGGIDLGFLFSAMGEGWTLTGLPATFITPDALLFEELDIQKDKRALTKKPPVVPNPVGKQD